MLLCETGKPLIQHTYEAALRATTPCGVCVAADHEEIAIAVRAFGGLVEMTNPDCASGTDRVAEVARGLDVDIVVNVQGDEPELSGEAIDAAVRLLEDDPSAVMSTLATPIRARDQLLDPSCVKVVFDARRRAMYFSRSPVPCARQWHDGLLADDPPHFHQHIGLYAYRRDFLLSLAQVPPSPLEKLEMLEQLRVLEMGRTIAVAVVPHAALGIDTLHDYQAFVQRNRKR